MSIVLAVSFEAMSAVLRPDALPLRWWIAWTKRQRMACHAQNKLPRGDSSGNELGVDPGFGDGDCGRGRWRSSAVDGPGGGALRRSRAQVPACGVSQPHQSHPG